MIKRGSIFQGGNRKKFFVLHPTTLSFHADMDSMTQTQGGIGLTDAFCTYNDAKLMITITHGRDEYVKYITCVMLLQYQ